MAIAVTAEGSAQASVENLIASSPHFGLPPAQAAGWLFDAAQTVAQRWEARMVQAGVEPSYLATLAQAFATTRKICEAPQGVEQALQQATRANARGRRAR